MGYLFQSLDRGNVSNAKSDGMTTDLNFPDNGYAVMLSVFYLPFCKHHLSFSPSSCAIDRSTTNSPTPTHPPFPVLDTTDFH